MTGTQPRLVDNLGRYQHDEALRWLASDMPATPLSIASGYVRIGGLHLLTEMEGNGSRVIRLLLGAMPGPGLGAEALGHEEEATATRKFEEILEALRGERNFDRFPPSRRKVLEAVQKLLSLDQVEVRRYTTRFLHGKAYLFAGLEVNRGRGATVVSSANLTTGGMVSNLELGLVDYNPDAVGAVADWFQELWTEADDFKENLLDLLFPRVEEFDPQTIFLRALLELYDHEMRAEEEEGVRAAELNLTEFQKDGYRRARRIIKEHGGVIYADGVGTGKTFVAGAFVEEYAKERGLYTLVIAPAQLRDTMWEPLLRRANLPHEVVSPQELAEDEQLSRKGTKRVLDVDKDAYRLIIVDEAHAFRNSDTTWYSALDRLLGGSTKDLLLLTATPVNNSLWDAHNMILLFSRHDAAFRARRVRIPSLKKLFLDAGAQDPEAVSEEKLFPLIDAVAVRRDRSFIKRHYSGERFPDGTPVKFPEPSLFERRYDLDSVYPGIFEEIVDAIASLTMARYRPSAYDKEGTGEAADERALAGLMQSALLKRFESSVAAVRATVDRLILAHEALVTAWDRHDQVPSLGTLRDLMSETLDGEPLPLLVAEALERDEGARPASAFEPEFVKEVGSDLGTLHGMRESLSELANRPDPKLDALEEILTNTDAKKVAVFSSFADTVRYIEEAIRDSPARFGNREMTVIIGSERNSDERERELLRFCPGSVSGRDDYRPRDGEVDLLIATDILSEGQNLQDAQAVVSFDLPWNPQRVVQRNGRIIRLKSPHDQVFLYTMLPARGNLEKALRLEARVRTKIAAANATFGMEGKVLSDVEAEERNFADLTELTTRLEEGDESLLDEGEAPGSSSFVGEQYRALLKRELREGGIARLRGLAWGIGSSFISEYVAPEGAGVFFACRSKDGLRHWRYVTFDHQMIRDDLEMIRRIDPQNAPRAEWAEGLDLEGLWKLAAEDICRTHNEQLDPKRVEEALPLSQRWALQVLRDPEIPPEDRYTVADESLGVGRNQLVRRALSDIRRRKDEGELSLRQAADEISGVIQELGLRPVPEADERPRPLAPDDLGVVCFQVVRSTD